MGCRLRWGYGVQIKIGVLGKESNSHHRRIRLCRKGSQKMTGTKEESDSQHRRRGWKRPLCYSEERHGQQETGPDNQSKRNGRSCHLRHGHHPLRDSPLPEQWWPGWRGTRGCSIRISRGRQYAHCNNQTVNKLDC